MLLPSTIAADEPFKHAIRVQHRQGERRLRVAPDWRCDRA
jgi:hypothetical protein